MRNGWLRSMLPLMVLAGLAALPACGSSNPDYLGYVRRSADTLLAHGLDVYGPKKTPLWAGVIDTRTMTVPRDGVPTLPGIRPHDRAVGGANAYHDVVTWRVFNLLSALTNRPVYASAVRDYLAFFLANAQNPKTGLLAWGEHLYYDFFRDEVAAERHQHELLEWTPPWDLLWAVNPEAVQREIAGIRYHYYADDPTALFNRHAWWDRPEHQKPGGQPWIKHTGLYAYSFSFLYSKTHNPLWLEWQRGVSVLYWNHRNPQTNLTLGCIGDPRPSSQTAAVNMPDLAYWLLKAWQLNPSETGLRDQAVAFLTAYDRYFYDPATDAYRASVDLTGKPLSSQQTSVWDVVYGAEGLLPVGRIAAYFAREEKSPRFLAMARRITAIAARQEPPADASAEGVAFALELNLDLYDLTGERAYLDHARHYADLAIQRFWVSHGKEGLFVRKARDPYYESKAGTGDLLAGLLRLHLRLHPKLKDPNLYDWSY